MNTENVIALSAVIIASLALILSGITQILAWWDRKLNRMPHLRIWLGTEQGGFVSFGVSNDGLGAAIVEEFTFSVDGQPVDFQMLFTSLFGVGREFVSQRIAPPPKEIGLQSSVELFRISSKDMSDHQLMHEFAQRVGVNIRARAITLKDRRTTIALDRIAPKQQA